MKLRGRSSEPAETTVMTWRLSYSQFYSPSQTSQRRGIIEETAWPYTLKAMKYLATRNRIER